MIIAIWIVSLILAAPVAVFSHVMKVEKANIAVCFPFPEEDVLYYPQINTILKALIFYFLPLSIITVFYVLMARFLWVDSHIPEGLTMWNRQESRKKVAKIVLFFVVIFAICFLPNHVHQLFFWCVFELNPNIEYTVPWRILRPIGFSLTFLNSCINPIALYFVSGVFRDQFNKNLFCCCHSEFTESQQERINRLRQESSRILSTTLRATDTIVTASNPNTDRSHVSAI